MNNEELIESLPCPKCKNKLRFYESLCYDEECCGLYDEIACYSCHWETSGYFMSLTEDEIKEMLQDVATGKRY